MRRTRWFTVGLASFLGGTALAQSPSVPTLSPRAVQAGTPGQVIVMPSGPVTQSPYNTIPSTRVVPQTPVPGQTTSYIPAPGMPAAPGMPRTMIVQEPPAPAANGGGAAADIGAAAEASGEVTGEEAQAESPGYGPTPLLKVHILQNALRCLCGKDPIVEKPAKKEDPCAPKKD